MICCSGVSSDGVVGGCGCRKFGSGGCTVPALFGCVMKALFGGWMSGALSYVGICGDGIFVLRIFERVLGCVIISNI